MSHAAGEKVPFTFADYLALPDGGRYRQVTIAIRSEVFRPGLFPGLEIPLDALFAA